MKSKRNKKSAQKSRKSSKKEYVIDLTTLKSNILKAMKKQKRLGYSSRTLLRELNLKNKKAKRQIEEALEALLQEEAVYLTETGRFKSSNEAPATAVATIDHVNFRFAFGIVEGLENDVRIDAKDLNGAIDGDTVEIEVFDPHHGVHPEGVVVKILKRKREIIVGTVKVSDQFAFVIPDSKRIHMDIYVPKNKLKEAQTGEKVLVKITQWAANNRKPEGVVTEVLGKAGEHQTEMHAIMAEFDLPYQFPKNILSAAKRIQATIKPEEVAKRRDMRKVTTFTIDPVDAKDFDDALSIQKLANGHWEIGIHIADVTHYVKPRTLLEKEAYQRATSVYLVDRVVPMLPERLSNELCSLRPHEDKLTFSAVLELDEEANIVKEWFGRTIIHSDRRFAYEEAQEVIETGKGDFVQEIRLLNELAYHLREKRFAEGAISFETMEVRFQLDEEGTPISVVPKVRKDAHKLIEEFMLLANKRVATFIYNKRKADPRYTMVYRIHDAPDPEKLQTFATFVQKFGYQITTKGKKMSGSFNRMVERMDGKAEQNFLQNLAIRTMSKAKYTTEARGHFGLAFEHYTHFTSPIRRYPDMMVHRLLQHYLDDKKSVDKETYEEKCKHSSEMEKRAADAERASIKYKQVEFMKLADEKAFKGIVTGLTEFGIYVEIVETKCEGMVRMSDIEADFFELDAENYRVIGKQTGKVIAFGDEVDVRVKETNLARRTIDLVFEEDFRQVKSVNGAKKATVQKKRERRNTKRTKKR